MIFSDQRKSFKKITSQSSAPTHVKLVVAGLVNVWKIKFSGFRMKVFPQFAGPVSNMFRYFPQPLTRRLLTASVKSASGIEFLLRISLAIQSHYLLQPTMHSSFRNSRSISMRVFLLLSNLEGALSISHPIIIASSTAL